MKKLSYREVTPEIPETACAAPFYPCGSVIGRDVVVAEIIYEAWICDVRIAGLVTAEVISNLSEQAIEQFVAVFVYKLQMVYIVRIPSSPYLAVKVRIRKAEVGADAVKVSQ